MENNILNVGIIGYGIVGSSTVETLIRNADIIKQKTGLEIKVKGVADLTIDRKMDDFLTNVPVVTKNGDELINDPEIDIIVELIGGYGAAKKFIIKALENGKHVVTANKALLATQGGELFNLADEKGLDIGFEASVAGGIPIIRVLKEDLAANNVTQIYGIINGTANYILSRMTKEGKDFAEVLHDAQEKGYAEADPTFDVEGIDTAHKICLLSSIAFLGIVPFDDIYVEGISNIKPIDIEIAKEFNCVIKLLAIAKKDDEGIEVRVHPTMIHETNLIASVDGVFNAVCVTGDRVDTTMSYGRGAGGAATSSAVVADIINIAKNIKSNNTNNANVLGFVNGNEHKNIRTINDISSSFYLRFTVADEPGVLANITKVLASKDISVSAALQREVIGETDSVTLVLMTHEVLTEKITKAVAEIDELPITLDKTAVIRMEI